MPKPDDAALTPAHEGAAATQQLQALSTTDDPGTVSGADAEPQLASSPFAQQVEPAGVPAAPVPALPMPSPNELTASCDAFAADVDMPSGDDGIVTVNSEQAGGGDTGLSHLLTEQQAQVPTAADLQGAEVLQDRDVTGGGAPMSLSACTDDKPAHADTCPPPAVCASLELDVEAAFPGGAACHINSSSRDDGAQATPDAEVAGGTRRSRLLGAGPVEASEQATISPSGDALGAASRCCLAVSDGARTPTMSANLIPTVSGGSSIGDRAQSANISSRSSCSTMAADGTGVAIPAELAVCQGARPMVSELLMDADGVDGSKLLAPARDRCLLGCRPSSTATDATVDSSEMGATVYGLEKAESDGTMLGPELMTKGESAASAVEEDGKERGNAQLGGLPEALTASAPMLQRQNGRPVVLRRRARIGSAAQVALLRRLLKAAKEHGWGIEAPQALKNPST
jgi:hypothetical protein